MTDRELMQQALDTFEESCYPRMSAKHSVRYDEIITALRERLAQPDSVMFTPDEARIALHETDFTWHNSVTQEMVDKLKN